jgi:hypothetical protein
MVRSRANTLKFTLSVLLENPHFHLISKQKQAQQQHGKQA